MLSSQVLNGLKTIIKSKTCSRNIRVFAPCLQKPTIDPIQQLFIDKIREYKEKSDNGKHFVDPSPELQMEVKTELEKIARQYSGSLGEDTTKFPAFKFEDPIIDPISNK